MLEQLAEDEFEVFNLPPSDIRKLLMDQDLKAPKITKNNYQIVKFHNVSYQAVIKSLLDLGYYKDGKDKYFPDCDFLIKYFPTK